MKNAFYVDDLLYGASSVKEAQDTILKLLETLGKEVLQDVEKSPQIESYVDLEKAGKHLKILLLRYRRKEDCFLYSIEPNLNVPYTTRRLLTIASNFDPIGCLLRLAMKLRTEIHRLWQEGYDWDDVIENPP